MLVCEQIVEVVWDLFEYYGYGKIMMVEIVFVCKMLLGNFYWYFLSKFDIVEEIVVKWMNDFICEGYVVMDDFVLFVVDKFRIYF